MHRLRVLTGLLAVTAALLLPSAVVAPAAVAAPAAATQVPPAQVPRAAATTADPAVAAYGGCLQGHKAGSLLLLVDESGSLQKTDAGDPPARVVAAKYLLRQLRDSTQRAGVRLDVAIGVFAVDYTELAGWTPLDEDSLGGLVGTVDELARRNNGFDTDYAQALNGARAALHQHATDDPAAGSCQAIAWFSDGELSLQRRADSAQADKFGTTKPYAEGDDLSTDEGTAAAQAKALDEICRGGGEGLADQLRAQGVITFGVGLAGPEATANTFDVMSAIATSQPAGGATCGEARTPPTGTFREARDIDDLLFAFDEVLGTGDPRELGICGANIATCTARHQFVLDESVQGVHILGSSDQAGIQARLIGPDGAVYDLPSTGIGETGTLDARGVTVEYSWQSDRTVAVDLRTTHAENWTGVWALVFVDPAQTAPGGRSRSNIHIWGDLVPAWLERPAGALSSGKEITGVKLGVTRTDGTPYQASTAPGTLTLSAVVIKPDGTPPLEVVRAADKTKIGSPVALDLTNVQPGEATLRLVLNVTTAPAAPPGSTTPVPGTPLTPQQVDLPLQIRTPDGYPTVAPSVDFGTADDGETELAAALPVSGPGCVWLVGEPQVTTRPSGVGIGVTSPSATSAETCLAVEEGQSTTLPLRMVADRTGNGTVTGTLTVSAAPPGKPEVAQPITVKFTANMLKPVNQVNRLLTLLALLLLGPGIPLAMLYFAKWWAARIPGHGLHAVSVPVTVSSGTREVLRDGTRFALGPRDTVRLVPLPARGTRHVDGMVLDVPGMTLRTRMGRSPFGAGYVAVQAPPKMVNTSEDPISYGDGSEGRLPLAIHDTFVVLHDPAGSASAAEVVVFISAGSSTAVLNQLAGRVNASVPDRIDQLRAAAMARGIAGRPGLVGAGVGGGGGVPADDYAPGYGPNPGGPPAGPYPGPPAGPYPGPPSPPLGGGPAGPYGGPPRPPGS